jgi:starch phosphorylase
LDDLLADDTFMSDLHEEIAALDLALADPAAPEIAYCSPEFAIDALVPQYAGGLGVLAGDHLKAASDLGLPLAGVGLFYRLGYFTQTIEHGRQAEHYHEIFASDLGAIDTGFVVSVPMPGREVQARVWRLEVGRIPLLLLDTNLESNSPADREISDRLYGGDRGHRLEQEMLLGVGGAKALAAHGWDIQVHHLNEGHAGFIILEMIDRVIEGSDLQAAVDEIGPGLVFTTHTPVPAGIDRFHGGLVLPYLEWWAHRWGVPVEAIWKLGEDPATPDEFNMAALALRVCSSANGVSRLHGEVSREIFAGIGCGDRIGSITNGVHARTWVGPAMQTAFAEILGPGWADGEPAAWDRVEAIDETTLETLRRDASARLADLVASTTGATLDPDALIFGFARRFAPYKRATLLLQDRDRLGEMLADEDRPVHFVFAGKSHPHDEAGKALLAEIVDYSSSHGANGRLTFIPGYDMAIAATLVEGSDVWLNNPVRPREASGTSGEKAALNGVLNCSILDGWWAEMFDGENGWQIATSEDPDPTTRDREEAAALYDTLAAIRDEYHGDRAAFHRRIRHAWRTLGPKVTAARMVGEYRDRLYRTAPERTGV